MVRGPGPAFGAGTGDKDEELLFALACEAEGLSRREIAAAIWGWDRVAEEYYPGCWMQSRVKRRLDRATAIVKRYREIAAAGPVPSPASAGMPPASPSPA